MDHDDIPFPDEIRHLSEIQVKMEEALKAAEEAVRNMDKEYRDMKQYMADYRGEIDPHEMFQTERLLTQTDRGGVLAVDTRNRLSRLKESPYFARIDFKEKEEPEAARYYIGRFSFNHKNELLIFDWRAPVSGMFYDCELGAAEFEAPAGRISGELTRKRQYKIKNGEVDYVLESSANVQDDVLQRELSHTSDEKMKSIISTIQKEQNKIIRNENAATLIIQGVAGSGKTSIALHRIAYLLYLFKGTLNARNVAILSPNKVFGDYISNVIPELGEEPIYELSFADVAEIKLEGIISFEADKDPLEVQDKEWKERVSYKSTLEFAKNLESYVRQLPKIAFSPEEYTFGRFTAERDWISARFMAYKTYSIRHRLVMVADDILNRFHTENIMEDELPRISVILKKLTAMLVFKNTLECYREFYKSTAASQQFIMPSKNTLEWSDVYPFLYVHSFMEDVTESNLTKHLVIDEMQDYTPIQYAALNRIFPCQKTILGDFGQFINPNHRHTLEDLKAVYPQAEFVMLNKSYRSSYEIIMFAKRIQNVSLLEPVKRHGEEPVMISCQHEHNMIHRIKEYICDFEKKESASLGIILKTEKDANTFYNILINNGIMPTGLNLLHSESAGFQNGVTVTSIKMSKGLEFDEVIIPHTDDKTYKSEYDRSLLYIACTRAMHRLTLLYTGGPSRLIGGTPPEF